jgi:hypothetical protein
MKLRVFGRRANPAVDPHIMRKSLSYCEAQVAQHLADWIDPLDQKKGIIAREMLYLGERLTPVAMVKTARISRSILPALEPNAHKFVGPKTDLGSNPIVRWMTAVIGKQTPKRFRMEAAALKRQAARMSA